MALSAAARAAIQKEKEAKIQGGGEGKRRLKFGPGETKVCRIVPRRDPDKAPIVSGFQHWHVENRPLPCPGGRGCDVCEELWQMKQQKHPAAEDAFVYYGKKPSGAFVVLVRGEEAEGPALASFGRNQDRTGVYDKVLREYPDPNGPHADQDPFDPKSGYDFTILKPKSDARYDYQGCSKWQSPLAATDEEIAAIIEAAEALDLDAEYAVTDEVQAQLKRGAERIRSGELHAPARQKRDAGGAAAEQSPAATPATPSAPDHASSPGTGAPPADMKSQIAAMKARASATAAGK